MCIPESDGTDEGENQDDDSPYMESSESDSDDSRKADPDYCIREDEVYSEIFRDVSVHS